MKIYKPKQHIPEDESYAYITAKGGHYLFKRGEMFNACVKVDEIPDLPEQEEFIEIKTPKIPLELIEQTLAFFQKVYDKYGTEAMVLLTYEEMKWGLYVPKQEVSGASVNYKNDEKRRIVGSIHSHPGFGANPSGTDEHDEETFDGIHMIATSFIPLPETLSVFAVANGRRFRVKPESIIEGLQRKGTVVSEEWLKKVKKEEFNWKEERERRLFDDPRHAESEVEFNKEESEIDIEDLCPNCGEEIEVGDEDACRRCGYNSMLEV